MGRPKKRAETSLPEEGLSLEERLLRHVASRLGQSDHPDATPLTRSFHAYAREAWSVVRPATPFKDNWYVGCLCEHLQAVARREIKRLIIACPPSHGKSVFCSVLFPSWIWTHSPAETMLFTSYHLELSQRDSMATRDVVLSDWYRERWGHLFAIKDDDNTKTGFANTRGGKRSATTPTGKGIGLKAGLVVVDDAHKQNEVHYDTKRQNTIDWWLRTMSTRGHDLDTLCHLVIGQRLREDDLSGTLMQMKDLGYEALVLPAEYEVGRVIYSLPLPDPLPRDAIVPTSLQRQRPTLRDPRTVEGQLLAPEIMSRAGVEQLKASLLADAPGQLQQRPSAQQGAIFQKPYFRPFRPARSASGPARGEHGVYLGQAEDPLARFVPLRRLVFFQTIDTAASIKETAAFTAIGTFALTPTFDLLVWHVWRYRLQVMELFDCVKAFRTGPATRVLRPDGRSEFIPQGAPWPIPLRFQAVEAKSTGIGLIQQGAASGHPFKVLKADGDKILRGRTVAGMYHSGKVYHKEGAQWLSFFEDELLSVPNGRYLDCYDVTAYAGILASHDQYTRLPAQSQLAYPDTPDSRGKTGGDVFRAGTLESTDAEGSHFRLHVSPTEWIEISFPD